MSSVKEMPRTGAYCSSEAYNACPKCWRCKSIDDAYYLSGSHCAKHNAKFESPVWVEDERGYFHCSECGFKHEEKEWTTSICPKCGNVMGEAVFFEQGDLDEIE